MWLSFDELRREIGAARAEAVLGRAAERLGTTAGRRLFAGQPAATPEDAARIFLAASPARGRLFPTDVSRGADGAVTIAVRRCPLQDAWREAGLGDDDVATLCRIAGRFDHGCFGEAGIALAAETWTAGRAGCCRLRLGAR
jgi:hypothetical protein